MTAAAFESIPEPTPVSRLGHLGDWLGVQNARQVIERVRRYSDECGGLARVQLGPKPILVVSEPALVAEVLGRDETNHKGLVYGLTRVVLNNVLLLNGTAWQENRRRYAEALQGADWTGQTAGPLSAWLQRLASLPAGSRLELDRLVPALVADLLGHLLCSEGFPSTLEPERHRIQYELAAVGIDIQCRPWAYLSARRFVELRRAVHRVRSFFRQVVEHRATTPGSSPPQDVLAASLAQGRPRDEIAEMLVNLFFTGHDVVSATLSFCLYLIANHPARSAGMADEPARLERVLLESLRLFPGYPLFAREATVDLDLTPPAASKVRVPRGTMIIVAPAAIHRLARYWDRPDEFDPDRWIRDPRDASSSGAWHFNGTFPYLPFGGGRRACLASRLVLPVLRRVVTGMARHTALRAQPGHRPELAYWGSVFAENGLPVRLWPAGAAPGPGSERQGVVGRQVTAAPSAM